MNLINKAAVRRRALEYAATQTTMSDGSPRFTRVAPGFLLHVEAEIHKAIRLRVERAGRVGRTLV